jgi:hypothetical protein
MKNAVFWDVTPCGSCKNVIVFLRSVRRLLFTANVVLPRPAKLLPTFAGKGCCMVSAAGPYSR